MDYRDAARHGRADKLKPDHDRMVLVDDWEDDEDFKPRNLGELPAVYQVCPLCDGRGKHVNPGIDSHGITAREFAEDPDFREEYFSGRYDVACYQCGGKRVVLEPDQDQLTPEQAKELERRKREHYEYLQELSYEQRYGY